MTCQERALTRLLYHAAKEWTTMVDCPKHTLCIDCPSRFVCKYAAQLLTAIESLKKGTDNDAEN